MIGDKELELVGLVEGIHTLDMDSKVEELSGFGDFVDL